MTYRQIWSDPDTRKRAANPLSKESDPPTIRLRRPDPTEHTPEEKAKAVATFQQWADDNKDVEGKVNEIFHDRRNSGSE